jgi:hypothetical protein
MEGERVDPGETLYNPERVELTSNYVGVCQQKSLFSSKIDIQIHGNLSVMWYLHIKITQFKAADEMENNIH